jgi:Leucine-rich repeat (LRR) protein
LSGNTSLNLALKQLVASNNQTLSTCLAADQKRLKQRFAYLALMFSTDGKDKVPSWFGSSNECSWFGVLCDGSTVTKLYLNAYKVSYAQNRLVGTIPDDVGLWTGLDMFDMSSNKLVGSLPSSIGLWTDLTSFGVSSNGLVGSLPSSIGVWTRLTYFTVQKNKLDGTVPREVLNWKSIQYAYFHDNMFNGTMPLIGNNFCPKNATKVDLYADCKAPAKIVCDCCDVCI